MDKRNEPDTTYFCDDSSVIEVSIPYGIKKIGENAFYNCTKLKSVTIPDSVTHIERSAFRNCEKLAYVTMPNSISSIDESAFDGCPSVSFDIRKPDTHKYQKEELISALCKIIDVLSN